MVLKISKDQPSHLSIEELELLSKHLLSGKELLGALEHLENCLDCQNNLPARKSRDFLQTILLNSPPEYLNESLVSTTAEDSRNKNVRRPFFIKFKLPVLAGVSGLLLMGMSFIAFFDARDPDSTVFQAKVLEKNDYPLSVSENSPMAPAESANVPVKAEPEFVPSVKRASNKQKRRVLEPSGGKEVNQKATVSKEPRVPKYPVETSKIIISKSRSASDSFKCPPSGKVTGVSPYFEVISERQPVFRWNEVPNAVKYQFYVSDTSQILVDKAETGKETSYLLKAPLELNKSYKWKVIATTQDGKTIASESINFSVSKKAQKYARQKVENVITNPNRCSQ